MRPTPIPDAEVWEGTVRRVISPPGGDLTNPDIAPVEALVDPAAATLSVRLVLEGDDLANLQAGAPIWLTFFGSMVPWAAIVAPATPPTEEPARD